MNRPSEQEQLLNEVLAEGMPETLRKDLFTQTLRHVRRRRRARRARRTVGALVVILVLAFIVWPRPHQRIVQSSDPKPYVLVRTQPLPRADFVTTVPLQVASQVESIPTVSAIATATEPHVAREIDDADLLSLAAPNPVILVRLGPHSAELVFAHTTEENTAEHRTEPQ